MVWAYCKFYPISPETCENAAYNGHLECLKYAYERNCEWNYSNDELSSYKYYIQDYALKTQSMEINNFSCN